MLKLYLAQHPPFVLVALNWLEFGGTDVWVRDNVDNVVEPRSGCKCGCYGLPREKGLERREVEVFGVVDECFAVARRNILSF
jgi:hypothetical protein